MRGYVKKKKYQMHVREMAVNGQGHSPNGSWAPSPMGSTNSSLKNSVEGARGAEPGVGRPRKGGKVKPRPEIYAARKS